MKRSIIAIAVASAMVLTAGNAVAQKGQGGPKGPKVKATQPAPKTTTGGPKLHASAGQGPKVKSTTTHGPKTQTTAKTHTTTTKTHGKPTTTNTTAAATKTKGPDRTATAATTTPTGSTLTLTPVQQKLQKNTNLASKLEGRLPAGTNVLAAAEGFRNLGQFVAAVNVANNLDISFADLKVRMVDDGMSLGQAIKAERNDVNVTTEVARAERDAQIIIADTDEAMKKKDVKPAKAKKRDGQ